MWRLSGSRSLDLSRDRGVAVVTSGSGFLNGLSVTAGDRLVFAEEHHLHLSGSAELIVCT